MTGTDPHTVARRVRRAVGNKVKRRALLAALNHPDLVRCRLVGTYGVLLEGPGGIVSTHFSAAGDSGPVNLLLRDLRRVGLA
jgi:hypothetical protein